MTAFILELFQHGRQSTLVCFLDAQSDRREPRQHTSDVGIGRLLDFLMGKYP